MTRRRAAVVACLAGIGWWRWHAQAGRWYTPESVLLHYAWEHRR